MNWEAGKGEKNLGRDESWKVFLVPRIQKKVRTTNRNEKVEYIFGSLMNDYKLEQKFA